MVLVSVLVLRGSVLGSFSSSWSSKAFYRLWRGAAPAPSPKFQPLNRGEKAADNPLPVTNNTRFLFGAKLGRLSLSFNSGRILAKVEVLHDSQQQMQEHQLQLLCRQQ